MTRKIFSSMCLLAALVLAALTIITAVSAHTEFLNSASASLKSEAELIRAGLETSGDAYLERLDTESVRVTVISPDGLVTYDSAGAEGSRIDRAEVIKALENGSADSVRYSESTSKMMIYHAERLENGSVLRLSTTAKTGITFFFESALRISAVAVAAVLLALFISQGLSSRIVKEVERAANPSVQGEHVLKELEAFSADCLNKNRTISRQMEELKLRASEFSALTDNMNEGMLVLDSMGYILSCNKSASSFLHSAYGAPQTLNKSTLSSVTSLNLGEPLRSSVTSALTGKRSESSAPLGERFYRFIANPVISEFSVTGAVIIIFDDTEKEHRDRLRREFTSNVSHELKTPLTSISGFAELIKCGIAGERAPHFAENIYSEAARLITLVNDIIKLSRIEETTGHTFQKENVELAPICESVAKRLAGFAEAKSITVSCNGNACIQGDKSIITEMVYNLCDNSIKYGNDGGHVNVSVTSSDSSVTLTVSDDGIGIPSDLTERVFERFFRVDKSHSKEIGGTGLGLSIVKHGALMHGAEIVTESEIGKGTSISIIFKKTQS